MKIHTSILVGKDKVDCGKGGRLMEPKFSSIHLSNNYVVKDGCRGRSLDLSDCAQT